MQDAVVKMNFGAIIEPTQECQSYTCTDTNQGISFVVNLGTSFLADEFDFVIGSITWARKQTGNRSTKITLLNAGIVTIFRKLEIELFEYLIDFQLSECGS